MRPKVILPPRYLGKHPQMRNDIKHQNGLEIGIDRIRLKSSISTDAHSKIRTYLIALKTTAHESHQIQNSKYGSDIIHK